MSDDQFQAMLDIHTVVPFRMARATAPIFKAAAEADAKNGERTYRKTVMVSSGAGIYGLPGASNYAAGKAGVIGLMKTAAKEWGRYNVCVNALAFGVIRTRFGMPQNEREDLLPFRAIAHKSTVACTMPFLEDSPPRRSTH